MRRPASTRTSRPRSPRCPARRSRASATGGEPADDVEWRAAAWAIIGLLVVTSIVVAAWYLPVYYGIPLPNDLVRLRFWPPSWP